VEFFALFQAFEDYSKNNFPIISGIFRILVGELAGTFLGNMTKDRFVITSATSNSI